MKAVLALESGKIFRGESFGAEGETTGEVVFNTSMAGYQEILTDPSYEGQIIAMTSPHIGNYGVNDEDEESRKPFGAGFIVREASGLFSSWRAKESLQAYLQRYGLVGIAGIDTRALTRHLREGGAMRGVVSTRDVSAESLIAKAKASPSMSGSDLAKLVSCTKPYHWAREGGRWIRKSFEGVPALEPRERHRVVVMDFGIKYNSLRSLSQRGCQVLVVPAQSKADAIAALEPDGVLISNGPGDPAAIHYGIENIQKLIGKVENTPEAKRCVIMGICLGQQLLGLALGGKTYKLKFGHRGGNHPVKDLTTGKIEITSQNHGFSVDADSLSKQDVEVTHINLNDKTCEGLRHRRLPIFAVQYHPEASPGPHDAVYLFDRFIEQMKPHA